jgi:hypothetical protein
MHRPAAFDDGRRETPKIMPVPKFYFAFDAIQGVVRYGVRSESH